MKTRHIIPALVGLALAAASISAEDPIGWNHNPDSPNGPKMWGSLQPKGAGPVPPGPFATCGSAPSPKGAIVPVGAFQSPIELPLKAPAASLPDLTFAYPRQMTVTMENTGHVIEASHTSGDLKIGPAALDGYSLQQFHFHTPSEHTVNGSHFSAEMHLVHRNALSGEIAVVGVFLRESPDVKGGIFDDLITAARIPHSPPVTFVSQDLLPAQREYYFYRGSLTTPPCSEGVRFFVLSYPKYVSPYFVRTMGDLVAKFPGYDGFRQNNRPVVKNPPNGYPVLRKTP